MHVPARLGDVVADVLLDRSRKLVWIICAHLPAPKLKVLDAATEQSLHLVKTSSTSGECPSALLLFAYDTLPQALLINGQEACVNERLEWLERTFASLPANAVLVTTMFKSDAHNLDSYIEHYTGKKAHGFILYDNNEIPLDPDKAIHWPWPYWKAEGVHCAQALQLLHAAALCAVYGKHTWLLNVDLDEYMISSLSLPDLVAVASAGGCDAVGVRSLWADSPSHGVKAVAHAPDSILKAPYVFAWPQRSKYMQLHQLENVHQAAALHRGIHKPAAASKVLILTPEEGRIFHFAFASGAQRNETLILVPTKKNSQVSPA